MEEKMMRNDNHYPTELANMIYNPSRLTGDSALQMRPYFPDSKGPGTGSTMAMYEEPLNLCREGWRTRLDQYCCKACDRQSRTEGRINKDRGRRLLSKATNR
jgi:hypothetical protein